jgi:hypothetical protein
VEIGTFTLIDVNCGLPVELRVALSEKGSLVLQQINAWIIDFHLTHASLRSRQNLLISGRLI